MIFARTQELELLVTKHRQLWYFTHVGSEGNVWYTFLILQRATSNVFAMFNQDQIQVRKNKRSVITWMFLWHFCKLMSEVQEFKEAFNMIDHNRFNSVQYIQYAAGSLFRILISYREHEFRSPDSTNQLSSAGMGSLTTRTSMICSPPWER